MKKRIVVIGGGIAGTAAANRLVKLGYRVTIVEKNEYLGGRMRTHVVDGAAIEMGACFMTNFYTSLQGFLADNNFSGELYASQSAPGVLRNGQVRMATLKVLAGNSALSWSAKMRLLRLVAKHLTRWNHLDRHAFWRSARYDTRSVADALAGKDTELLEYLLQPALNGYLYWTPEHTSEAMISNLVKAGIGWRRTYRILCGLQRIPEHAAQGATIMLGSSTTEVITQPDGTHSVTVTHGSETEVLHADGIVCATTATAVPRIFQLDEHQRAFFQDIQYSSTALLARVYPEQQVITNKSIAFPRKEGVPLAAVTAWRERGSKDQLACVKTYASGAIGKELCEKTDQQISEQLIHLMEPVHGLILRNDTAPVATHVQRWPEALPHFDVGHLKRLEAFEKGEIENPSRRITFAGDYLGGPFMEGAFTSGVRAAERLHTHLQ